MQYLVELDKKLFLFINGLGPSGWDYWLGWPTFLITPFIFIVVLIYMFIWDDEKILRKFLIVLAAAFLGGFVLPAILKHTIQHPRPFSVFRDEMAQGKVTVNIFFQLYLSNSFPSGHSALVFSVVTALNHIYKNKLWLLYLIATYLVLTRIYVGAHFPSDVVAGAVVGIIGARITFDLARVLRGRLSAIM